MRTRQTILVIAALAAVLSSTAPAQLVPGTTPNTPKGRRLIFLFSGDLRGEYEPCGCASGPRGGISRRGTFVENYRRAHPRSHLVLLEGSGLAPSGDRKYQTIYRHVHQALVLMGYDAVGVGPWAPAAPLPGDLRVCANLYLGNRRLYAGLRKRTLTIGGRQVTLRITSVMNKPASRQMNQAGVTVRDSTAELTALLKADRNPGPTITCLLYEGSGQDAHAICRKVPGIDVLFMYGSGEDVPTTLQRAGSTLIARWGHSGREVGRLQVDVQPDGTLRPVSLDGVSMDPVYPDHKTIRSVVDGLQAELGAAYWPKPKPRTSEYAGSEACKECHAEQYRVWQGTSHAKAMDGVRRQGKSGQLNCLACHATGADHVTGYAPTSTTAAPTMLGSVGCEACHGPLATHARTNNRIKAGKVPAGDCLKCHNSYHGRPFNGAAMWPKVAHPDR